MATSARPGRARTALRVCAWVLFVTGIGAYALGLLGVLISETDEACSQKLVYEGADFREMRTGLVPLENTCVFEDGTTYADIPGWVNPLFFGGVGGALVCVVAAVLVGRSAGKRG
ncbi:hypothetical protein [Actinokineospora pegani]|uniref:hypothetical protein n=1 Tax=Actinokineospora pegani TaxID=2654637 RepID=UPI0012EA9D51|nr:hypothetical protein [Actinokineospora pegani]